MHTQSFIAALLTASLLATASVARAGDLPRYKLNVGDVLTYETSSSNEATGRPASQSAGIEQLIVTGTDGDGWKVVVMTREHALPPATQPASTQPTARDDTELGSGTIHPDGHPEEETLSSATPQTLFLPLPATGQEMAGYTAPGPNGGTWSSKATEHTPTTMTLAARLSAPLLEIYHSTQNLTMNMDLTRGIVTKTAWQFSMDNDGRSSHGTQTATLKTVEKKDAAWAAKIGSDTDALTAATKAYYAVVGKMIGDEAAMKAAMAQAQQAFVAAKAGVTTPEVLAEFDDRIKQHDTYQKYTIREAQQTTAVLNKPAPDWTLDRVGGGEKIALKDLRGKVVLLDFWYKDCPWCIRAMPSIKQLAADYQNKGVVVVGMNVDKKESDAQLTIDTLHLNYPSVKTSYDFAKTYGVSGYPTLIVIDQQGIVRKMDMGFTPTLRKDLGDVVDGLLKGNGA